MSYRVEIAAAEESSSETRERQKRGLTTEYTEFHRESHDALAVEFDVEAGTEWDELLAQAEFMLRGGADGAEDEEESAGYETGERLARVDDRARERRIYRGRTVAMLR